MSISRRNIWFIMSVMISIDYGLCIVIDVIDGVSQLLIFGVELFDS